MQSFENSLKDGMANQEIDTLANDMGVPAGMDGVINKEADNFINGAQSQGASQNFEQTAGDGMINQEINQAATSFGVPTMMDGAIDQAVDQEANKFL